MSSFIGKNWLVLYKCPTTKVSGWTLESKLDTAKDIARDFKNRGYDTHLINRQLGEIKLK